MLWLYSYSKPACCFGAARLWCRFKASAAAVAIGAMLAMPAASAGGYTHRAPSHHHRDGPDSSLPPDAAPDFYSEIGIDVSPEIEHWPSNYQPDGYRLRGYDGREHGHHFCRGAHGTTLSSSGTVCPPGQKSETGTHRYSTEGD